jgi:hypothetical protein
MPLMPSAGSPKGPNANSHSKASASGVVTKLASIGV